MVIKVLYMRHRGAGTHGDFMASQIELVQSTHGLSRAGRFRPRLGAFVQSGSLNSVVVVTHAERGGGPLENFRSPLCSVGSTTAQPGQHVHSRASTMRFP